MRSRLYLVVFFCYLMVTAWSDVRAQGGSLSIAAASDLVFCLEELNASFKKIHPDINLKAATGSSGNFFAQIQNGAPFDVFLSADLKYPRELIKAGMADSTTLTMYAVGRIVLWTVRTNIDLSGGLKVVLQPNVKRFAIANPEHAPYGRAARAALENAGVWDNVRSRLVFGENITQTAQFIQTGNADAGIVALSLVLSPELSKQGRYIEIPESMYPRLEQGAVLTRTGVRNPASRAYLTFLRSPRARAIFDRYGFRLPR